MKTYFDIIRRRPRLVLLSGVAIVFAVLAIRLAYGPIRVDAIRPIIISRLEHQIPRTQATIGHLDLVWFGDARAVGFRIQDLIITDRQHRIIARAGKLEAALAADSLMLAHLAPARLTAEDFFLVTSVSREGRYDLGYDSRGLPHDKAAGLDRFFYDLTGPEKLGRPASFARQVILKNGQVRLIQAGAPLDMTAHVTLVDFIKLEKQLKAEINLEIQGLGIDKQAPATLRATATGVVGLGGANISADLRNLRPNRVFPSVGVTKFLGGIAAPVSGLAKVSYSKKKGFEGAFFDLSAGKGRIDIGDFGQTFDEARIKATYRSATRTALFQTLHVKSSFLDTDLSGTMQIAPADAKTKRDLAIGFNVSGPRVSGRLADDFASQTLTKAHFKGSYTPRQRKLIITDGRAMLNGAALTTKGIVYADDQGQLGADLTARLDGHFGKDEVFAFWPESLSPMTRTNLIERIRGGNFANANFILKAKPGHFKHLENEDLRLDFAFSDLTLAIEKRLQNGTELRGRGTLLGNSFSLNVDGGRLVDVYLTKGGLNVPDFRDHATHTSLWLESHADVASVLEAIDPITDGNLARHGLTGERLNGNANARVDIAFPTFQRISNANFGLKFIADVSHGSFKQAALGWDLSDASLKVSGDLLADRLEIAGPATLGPYQGDISYKTQLTPKTQLIDFNGHFNAAQFGGSPKVPVKIKGHFTIANRQGLGAVTSDIFAGNVKWKGLPNGDEERPTDLSIEGVMLSEGMEDQGLPIFERLKREIPTRISLLRSGDIWSGELEAESLSGDIAYVQGTRPRLVYKSIITPEEADELGYGGLPMFSQSRHLTVNVALDGESKEALINLDQMTATLGWKEVPGSDELLRRLSMKLLPEDWYVLGLPKTFFVPPEPMNITALWQQSDGYLKGQVQWPGQLINFDMPLKSRGAPPPIQLPNTSNPYQLQVRTTLDDAALAALGYTQTPVGIQGNMGLVFSLYDMPGQPAAVLNLDATHARLSLKRTNWFKPDNEPAQLAVSFDNQKQDNQVDDSGLNVSRIYGQGEHIGIDGRAAYSATGELEFADFSKVYLKDFADIAFKYYVVDDPLGTRNSTRVISVSGRQLDLRPWLESVRESPVKSITKVVEPITDVMPDTSDTHLVVNLDHLRMAKDGTFNHLDLDMNWNGHNGLSGTGTVKSMGGHALSLFMQDEGQYSLFTVKTDNLGDVVDTATDNHNVKGGRAIIDGAYANGQVEASLRGNNIRVKQIPILAQLLTVASLQGLNDTLIGDGILFEDFDFPMRYRNDVLFIKDGWARGDAIGINVWGTSDFNSKKLNMNGSLIPAYRINSIFGDLKSNGLGLVGLKYDLRGHLKQPQVTVNPLSVVLPGFVKAWADSSRVDAMPALDLPMLEDKLDKLRDENDKKLKK